MLPILSALYKGAKIFGTGTALGAGFSAAKDIFMQNDNEENVALNNLASFKMDEIEKIDDIVKPTAPKTPELIKKINIAKFSLSDALSVDQKFNKIVNEINKIHFLIIEENLSRIRQQEEEFKKQKRDYTKELLLYNKIKENERENRTKQEHQKRTKSIKRENFSQQRGDEKAGLLRNLAAIGLLSSLYYFNTDDSETTLGDRIGSIGNFLSPGKDIFGQLEKSTAVVGSRILSSKLDIGSKIITPTISKAGDVAARGLERFSSIIGSIQDVKIARLYDQDKMFRGFSELSKIGASPQTKALYGGVVTTNAVKTLITRMGLTRIVKIAVTKVIPAVGAGIIILDAFDDFMKGDYKSVAAGGGQLALNFSGLLGGLLTATGLGSLAGVPLLIASITGIIALEIYKMQRDIFYEFYGGNIEDFHDGEEKWEILKDAIINELTEMAIQEVYDIFADNKEKSSATLYRKLEESKNKLSTANDKLTELLNKENLSNAEKRKRNTLRKTIETEKNTIDEINKILGSRDISGITQREEIPDIKARDILSYARHPGAAQIKLNGELEIIDMSIPQSPSSPYGIDATANKQPFENIIIHDTGSQAKIEDTVRYSQSIDRTRGGSFGYHFFIGKDGNIIQGAPLDVRTNHILPSDSPMFKGRGAPSGFRNSNSIGIALQGWGEHTTQQKEALTKLIAELTSKYGIDTSRIKAHGDVNPGHRPTIEGRSAMNYALQQLERNNSQISQNENMSDRELQQKKEEAAALIPTPIEKPIRRADITNTSTERMATNEVLIPAISASGDIINIGSRFYG